MPLLYDYFVKGTWEKEGYSTDGGPECYAFTPVAQIYAELVIGIALILTIVSSLIASPKLLAPSVASYRPGWLARLMQANLIACVVWQVRDKAASGSLVLMLQPCHVAALLFSVVLNGTAGRCGLFCAAIALSNVWGYAIALAMPDASAPDAMLVFYLQVHTLGDLCAGALEALRVSA